jgi:hypothetical protein
LLDRQGGQALAYVYFRRSRGGARRPTYDEAWRIAANVAKLPQGAAAEATALYRPHFRYDLNSGHFAALRSLTSWGHGDWLYLHGCRRTLFRVLRHRMRPAVEASAAVDLSYAVLSW